tara:strand:- start:815 stop:2194 length:1380 start_codon:yes stop_codon:yes gene_type:complete
MGLIKNSLLDIIGNTPLIKLNSFDTGKCELFVKLENHNPGGSIKDRIGLTIIEEAENSGLLKPGGTIIEATAGNTGIGLALVAAIKGYKLILVIPDKMSKEKILHLEGLGARVVITRSDVPEGHPEYYQDVARKMASELPDAFLADQFSNPANPLAHRNSTGPEIWDQMEGNLDAVIAGVGSGGTVTGLAEFFKEKDKKVQMVVADPVGSIVADAVIKGTYKYDGSSWFVEGIGEDFIPNNLNLDLLDDAITVSDSEAFEVLQKLLKEEGILAGSSTGTLVSGAIKWCKKQDEPRRVVTFVCDTGNKYLSKAFNQSWLKDNDLLKYKKQDNLADLISRRADKDEMVTIKSDDTLLTAYNRMRASDISQLPVLKEGKLVGIVDEEDLMLNVYKDESLFSKSINSIMVSDLDIIDVNSEESKLYNILSEGKVAIVFDKETFLGFITKVDLINRYKSSFMLS